MAKSKESADKQVQLMNTEVLQKKKGQRNQGQTRNMGLHKSQLAETVASVLIRENSVQRRIPHAAVVIDYATFTTQALSASSSERKESIVR